MSFNNDSNIIANENPIIIPKNVIFLSGMHGSGKTTLKRVLEEMLPYVVPFKDTTNYPIYRNIFNRQIRRIAKYRIDLNFAAYRAKQEPDKVFIADRCIFDEYMYLDALLELNWLIKVVARNPVAFSHG